MGIKVVESDSDFGIYVWQLDDGGVFGDGQGNILNVPGYRFDISKMNAIREVAMADGAGSGSPRFLAGVQRVSEMRYSEEKGRMAEGYIPSETDIGAWKDAKTTFDRAMERGLDYDA